MSRFHIENTARSFFTGSLEHCVFDSIIYFDEWYRSRRVLKDEDRWLFDPAETPELAESWGEEFETFYR